MFAGYKAMRAAIFGCPRLLLSLPKNLQDEAEKYLPYSTGFEIECTMNREAVFNDRIRSYYETETLHNDIFRNIPNIIQVSNDTAEQRYRIPAGVKGLICLYDICNNLVKYSKINKLSGIHYHVDMTDVWYSIQSHHISLNRDWILKALESWKYTGKYNKRGVEISRYNNTWVRLNGDYRTAEIRIGEMSFDYKLLVKRIIHCNNIIKALKKAVVLDTNMNVGKFE